MKATTSNRLLGPGRRRRGAAIVAVTAGLVVAAACGTSPSSLDSTPPGGGASTATQATAAGPLPAATRAEVERLIRQFQETNNTPGVLVGIWSPQGTFVSATGVADLATGEPLRSDMQFKIASQTKGFTGNLVLQLVGEGKVGLDDRISKWIEGVPNGDEITIRQLLNHTSGLASGFPADKAVQPAGCTVEELLAFGAAQPPVAAPGEKWSYSNYGYYLLGRVVELATGQDLSTVLHERIAEPLGLSRTLLATSGNGLSNPFTHGYGKGELALTGAPTPADDAIALPSTCLWAAGGVISTLDDLHVWSRALATGALLEPEVWAEAQANPVPFVFEGGYNGPGQWRHGLGFVESGGFFGKEGSQPGYESTGMYSPARQTAIVMVSTRQPNTITPPPMLQALAIAIYGDDVDFGLTLEQAMEPNLFGS